MAEGGSVYANITPEAGKTFTTPPTIHGTNITDGTLELIQGTYVMELTNPTGPVTITLAGTAEAATYPVTLVSTGLKGATARVNLTEMETGDIANVTVSADEGKRFAEPPVMTLTNAHEYTPLAWDSDLECYFGRIDNPTGPVTVTVTGEAGDSAYTATLNTTGLKGATATLSKTTDIQPNDPVKVTIKPDAGKRFDAAPTMTLDGATVKAELQKRPADGAYVGTISTFTKNATVTIAGEAVDGWSATIDKSGLKGGTATITPKDGLGPDSVAILDVVFDGGAKVVTEPTVTVTNAEYKLALKNGNTYTYEVTKFTGNATVKVTGEAKAETYTAKLDTAGLKGATATLDKTSDISGSNIVWLKIVPEAGKSFASDPVVTATNATATISKKASDGSYLFTVTKFTGNATVKVTGEAKAGNAIDIKVSGDGKHVVGAGGTLTFTCPLPLAEMTGVLVDGKALAAKDYEAKSGSTIVTLKAAYLDTLAVGKHTITLAYTKDRAASVDFEITKSGAKPVPSPDDGKKLAKTGDPLDAAPIAGVLGLSGIVALAGAFALRRKAGSE